ncbi:LysR substrate-binding domain-containing protein [Shewanella submarina]|uniref:LysR substrate-binding domain-containing protein n=1 Tax=Shewanella submarina TaxID=2016376 RepID=A0ABV7GDH9_9GAMM|nr:LysR substrate-binding domain-containing protein [Shewanella submarina]
MRITLKQLMVFDAIARSGQVAKAAELVCQSAPATSMALAELEKQLDTRLFERRGNRLHLNAQGALLLPMAAEVLDRVNQIEHAFSGHGDQLMGKLSISASSTIGNYLLASCVVAFSELWPKVEVDMTICNTHEAIDAVADGCSEMAYIEGICLDRRLTVEDWHSDRLTIFCAPCHPLAGANVSLQELAKERWVLRESGSGTREVFLSAVMTKGLHPDIPFSFGRPEAVKQAARQGCLLGVLSSLTLQQELERGELAQVHVADLALSRPFSRIKHSGRTDSALGRAFHEFSLKWLAEHK